MECPDCRKILRENAKSCQCGWGKVEDFKKAKWPHLGQCSHEGCPYETLTQVRTKIGWATFCRPHYEEYHLEQAEAYCASNGLSRLPEEARDHWIKRVREWNRNAVGALKQKMIVNA